MKLLSVMLIIFLSASLYSINIDFGVEKTLNFLLFQVAPILVLTNILINKIIFDLMRIRKLLFFVGTAVSIIIILLIPFDQSSGISYVPSINRWSHVFTGRLLANLILVIALISYTLKLRITLLDIFSFILMFAALLLTELRAAVTGLFVITFMFVYFEYLPGKSLKEKFTISLVSVIVIFSGILFLLSFGRFAELKKIFDTGGISDGSLLARIDAAKVAWQGFVDSPIIGHGFGSFSSNVYSDLGLMMKYPHNLFLEAGFEFGIIGLIGLIFLLYLIFKSVINYNRLLIYFFIFSFWMALFSKDFATQSFLWIGIGFIRLKGEKDKR